MGPPFLGKKYTGHISGSYKLINEERITHPTLTSKILTCCAGTVGYFEGEWTGEREGDWGGVLKRLFFGGDLGGNGFFELRILILGGVSLRTLRCLLFNEYSRGALS